MNFAVTGGIGFVGSHLVKHLVSKGHNVAVIDNQTNGRMSNLEEIKEKLSIIKLDILDFDDLKNSLQNMDGIFHQAALTSVSESYKKTSEYENVNIKGTENIFKIGKEFGIKVVYASSASVYGDTDKIPTQEDCTRKPINPYGITKLEAEYLAEKYYKLNSKIVGLRYFNVYGVGQTSSYAGVITKFLENLSNDKSPVVFGDGSQFRDFIFVKDVAEANLTAMNSTITQGFFNVGTGIPTTIKDLAYLMIKIFKKDIEPIFDKLPEGDVKFSLADNTLAQKMFGWKYVTSMEEGLRTLV